jgi:uracil-DNA glycosylase family protein
MAIHARSAEQFIPPKRTFPELRKSALACKGCDLYLRGTQTVFGEGNLKAKIMLVGEQPGDREDLEGRPFVGPAGHLLDGCLLKAGIDRTQVYVTNIVKHFKWEPRGKRRIHEKPNSTEIMACTPWLDTEIDLVKPRLIVCLGATAAQGLLGKTFRVTKNRGQKLEVPGYPPIVATVHPSSILRAREATDRERETAAFIADLKKAAAMLD